MLNTEFNGQRVPTLVSLCQRVAIQNINSLSGFGEELRYDVIKPILNSCNAEQLMVLEDASPHIQSDTQELWKFLCFAAFPLGRIKYEQGELEEPKSWRDHYCALREMEEKRIAEIGARVRTQRLEAEERKREREVKLTDRIPPAKRARWGASQPKTLFEKTRSQVSRIQRSVYAPPILPPAFPNGKNFRVLPASSSSAKVPVRPSSASTGVTVNTVTIRRSVAPTLKTSEPQTNSNNLISPSNSSSSSPALVSSRALSSSVSTSSSTTSSPIPRNRPLKTSKKDPTASLFMPKHRAYSQLRS